MIIALAGPAGSGKSEVARHLEQEHGFTRIRFAGPLKAMLRAFLASTGMPPDEVERAIEGDLKQVPLPALGGATPRHAMQTLGTEWGRDMIHPDLWASAWMAGTRAALKAGALGVVVEDCRFPNEAAAVRALGGLIVRLDRPAGALALAAHASEGQPIPFDVELANDRTLATLVARVDDLIGRLVRLAA